MEGQYCEQQPVCEQRPSWVLPFTGCCAQILLYAEGQWSPWNPEGKKNYDRRFLLQFQHESYAMLKPAGLPDIPDIILDEPNNVGRQYSQELSSSSTGSQDFDFNPKYVWNPRPAKGIPHKPRKNKGGPAKRQINLSISKEINLHKTEDARKPTVVDKKDAALSDDNDVPFKPDDTVALQKEYVFFTQTTPLKEHAACKTPDKDIGVESMEIDDTATIQQECNPGSSIQTATSNEYTPYKATKPDINSGAGEDNPSPQMPVQWMYGPRPPMPFIRCFMPPGYSRDMTSSQLPTYPTTSHYQGMQIPHYQYYGSERIDERRPQGMEKGMEYRKHDITSPLIPHLSHVRMGPPQDPPGATGQPFGQATFTLKGEDENEIWRQRSQERNQKVPTSVDRARQRREEPFGQATFTEKEEDENEIRRQRIEERKQKVPTSVERARQKRAGEEKIKKMKYTKDDSAPSSRSTGLLIHDISTKLDELIVGQESDNETVFDWIETNVDEPTTKTHPFIRVLMTAVCKCAIQGEKGKKKVYKNAIKARHDLLQKYLDHQGDLELQALYALQSLVTKLEHPKGVLRTMFDTFYDEDIISEDAFIQWEKSEDEPEGKGVALKQVVQFFAWLREAEDEG